MKNVLHFKLGTTFPTAMVAAGYVVMGIGSILTFDFPIGCLMTLVISGFICFTTEGVIIDLAQRRFKGYTRIYGIIRGKWDNLDTYKNVTILKSRLVSRGYSRANVSMVTSDNTYYEIYLVNETHRKKVLLRRLKGQVQAMREMEDISKKLGMEYAPYSPQISEQTRARREREGR